MREKNKAASSPTASVVAAIPSVPFLAFTLIRSTTKTTENTQLDYLTSEGQIFVNPAFIRSVMEDTVYLNKRKWCGKYWNNGREQEKEWERPIEIDQIKITQITLNDGSTLKGLPTEQANALLVVQRFKQE